MITLANPVHPGRILQDEFLDELGLSAGQLAKALHVPRTRIERLIKGKTSMTVDTSKRLEARFGMDAGTWMNLQTNYDLA
ncbi:MAG: HigA family addiction module antitoxin, partial [Pseudomonadota bacterium]